MESRRSRACSLNFDFLAWNSSSDLIWFCN
jgi:hypothetical protein